MREVRQRCGFGCVVCGKPLYEYDHFVPYSEVKEHDPDNLVLLCDQHHREKGSGLLPLEKVKAAKACPINRREGKSAPYDLHYSADGCQTMIGSNVVTLHWFGTHSFMSPLIVDDTPIVLFRIEDGHLLLTVQLFDKNNEIVVQIVDNRLVFSTVPWDIEFVGTTVTVRNGPGDIFVGMTFEPPSRVSIDRGHVWRNGAELKITKDELRFGAGNLTRCAAHGMGIGFGIGNVPPVSSAAMLLPAGPRESWQPQPETESRVLTIAGPTALLPGGREFLDPS